MRTKREYANRGSIAVEYVLIAAIVAIALMSAFGYFSRTVRRGAEELTHAAALSAADSVKEAMDARGTK